MKGDVTMNYTAKQIRTLTELKRNTLDALESYKAMRPDNPQDVRGAYEALGDAFNDCQDALESIPAAYAEIDGHLQLLDRAITWIEENTPEPDWL